MPVIGYNGEYYYSGWISLTPQNGWTAKAGTGTNLPPISYAQSGSTVQLRGELTPPGLLTGNLTILTLPAAACPAYEYVFPAAGLTGLGVALICNIRVKPDGTINLEGVAALASIVLNGIRFTVAS